MKKIVLIIVIALYLILPIKIYAGEMDTIISWTLEDNVFVHRVKDGNETIEHLAYLRANDELVYCLEPGIKLEKNGVYNSTNDISIVNMDDETLKYITLVGYYGYQDHNVKEYRMAAQELIWEKLGTDVWWTTSNYSNVLDIEYYKNRILDLVNSYEIKPSFNFKKNYIIGSEITLNDDNNVLSNYYSDSENVKIYGNEITIKITKKENKFILKRKTSDNMITFYYKDKNQTTALFKSGYPLYNSYTVNGIYKDINLQKKDKDTMDNYSISSDATLEDAIYGLYDSNDNLIMEEKTNEKGILTFNNVSYGNYYIKEIKPSIGYTLDNKKYDLSVNEESLDIIVSYEKIIENKINIIKFLKDNDNFKLEPNIEFEIYDSNNNLYNTYKTDENGVVNMVLPYGKYILKQKTILDGITVAEDTSIDVKDDGKTNNIVLINEKIKLPQTGINKNYSFLFIIEFIMLIIYRYEKKNN